MRERISVCVRMDPKNLKFLRGIKKTKGYKIADSLDNIIYNARKNPKTLLAKTRDKIQS